MPTNMTMREFLNSKYYDAITSSDFKLTEWIPYTEEEMEKDESKKINRWLFKDLYISRSMQKLVEWNEHKNKAIICSMPNFDANVF